MVIFTLLHAKFLNGLAEFTKPRTWTLFQTIQRLPKTTNPPYLPLSNKPWRLLHIHLLLKVAMKKGILNIKLAKIPTISDSQGNKKPNRCHLSNRGKSVEIVHAIDLGIPSSNKVGFHQAMDPSGLTFTVNTQRQPIAFFPTCKRTKSQEPLSAKAFISSIIALRQPG